MSNFFGGRGFFRKKRYIFIDVGVALREFFVNEIIEIKVRYLGFSLEEVRVYRRR